MTVAPADRWLLAFSIAAVLVLAGGSLARREARRLGARDRESEPVVRGLRRRAGALLALGPLVGLLLDPGAGDHVVVTALGALGLAAFGAAFERRQGFSRPILGAAAVAALAAGVSGVRFAPTGLEALDVLLGVAFVWLAVVAVDGLGNADGLVPGLGVASGIGVLALAAFAGQLGPANVAAGLVGACGAYLAFNVRPASLFAGRAGRLVVGYTLGVTALAVEPSAPAPASLVVPLLLLAIPCFDAVFVAVERLRRRRPLLAGRRDHLVHRLLARDATTTEAVLLLLGVQFVLAALAVFAGRGVLSLLFVVPVAALALGLLGGAALRAETDRIAPLGFSGRVVGIVSLVVVALGLAVLPVALTVPSVAGTMQEGRKAAERGLAAARNGDAANAEFAFRRAARHFATAADRMGAATLQPARLVPGLAPNVRAARTLAEVGRDLSRAGETVAATVVPENLEVIDGRVDLDEVARVAPALDKAATTLEESLRRVRAVAGEPYLFGPVRTAVREVQRQLARSAGEARRTATAARLAPALLGGDGPRRYLLVVQNNAEARATGGFIGSYGVLTAVDGKVSVGRLSRTGAWNAAIAQAVAADPSGERVRLVAPADYVRRYGQYQPERTLQNVNLSPDFPTVAGVLMGLTEAAGVGPVDGVMAVDPKGLAALLALTGPVRVPDWPAEITAENVVDVTLRDAYQEFARTPERAEFLGDVAEVVVDEATSGSLGKPARVAQVLGAAAHEGHLSLAFARPREQRLAEALDAAGAAPRAGRDTLLVTTQNFSANKLDYYLRRTMDYRVTLTPRGEGEPADATGLVTLELANTAPGEGLPRIVAGPWEGQPGRFREGELLSFVSVYSPMDLVGAKLDGQRIRVVQTEELGTKVASTLVSLAAGATKGLALELAGEVPLGRGGWYTLRLGHQPSLEPDRARVSITVPEGWRIDRVSGGLVKTLNRRAARIVQLDRPLTLRVRIVPDATSLWERLRTGS